MNIIDNILQINNEFTSKIKINSLKKSKYPQKKLAIISCMDTRLIDFLEPALGIHRGDAKIIKTGADGCLRKGWTYEYSDTSYRGKKG